MSDAPISMLLEPSEEERLLREAVFNIASNYGAKYTKECSQEGKPPIELWEELAKGGFLGVNLPTEYGGGGMGMAGLAAVQEELAHAGTSLLLLVVSPAIAGSILVKHGSVEQKQTWLPELAAATTKLAFAITEPDAGSNSHLISTNATRTDSGTWLLNGQKTFISGVEMADGIFVVARARQEDGTLGLPICLIIDVDAEGLTRQEVPISANLADKQWTLFFDNVEVPDERLIGGETGGLAAVFDGLNPERIMAAAASLGGTKVALDKASEYARTREVWGTPIGTHQAIAHPLAEIYIQYVQTRLMLQKATALYDAGAKGAGEAANIAKFAAADLAVRAADRAIQTHGGNGMTDEYGLVDLWLASRVSQIAPVSREMILNYVAQHSLGLPKSY